MTGGDKTMTTNPLDLPVILKVEDLETKFFTPEGTIHAVNRVSFNLHKGETLGVVGESGCGKTVTMNSVLRMIPTPPGRIVNGMVWFDNKNLLEITDREIRDIRGAQISMIFQDPMVSLNPVLTIGRQVAEPLVRHRGMSMQAATHTAIELLDRVGIPEAHSRINNYPHQFSGGMRQRVMIAMSLICDPRILIADEPTTALDVTIQAQIVELVKQLCSDRDMSVIWITHDLGVVASLAQRVIVMYAGFIIEDVLVDELYAHPQHPYTIGLLGSLPRIDRSSKQQELSTVNGAPPLLISPPKACPFRPRCKYVHPNCGQNPALIEISPHHKVACWVDPAEGRLRQ
jgi:oligopeptide transport system ATP-binding protein